MEHFMSSMADRWPDDAFSDTTYVGNNLVALQRGAV